LGPAHALYEVVDAHLVDGVGPDALGGGEEADAARVFLFWWEWK
jgi:hypothetical protein